MQTGTIIDFYDDPMGSVLKTKVAHAQLPDYVRSAAFQTEEKLASLPDDAFALIMVDNGKAMRKFACVDKGNTALSVLYFMETKDKLPEEAQKVAAANLLGYCMAFGLDVPTQVKKIAGVKMKEKDGDLSGTEIMPLQSNPNKADDADSQINASKTAGFKRLQRLLKGHTLDKIKPGQHSPRIDATDRAMGALKRRVEKAGVTAPEYLEHMGVDRSNPGTFATAKGPGHGFAKASSALYVDVTGKEPAPKMVKQAHSNYALHKYGQGRFPLDSYGDVLEANRWFEENGKTLQPTDRQEYCTKLAARADQLGISVTSTIRKYASTTFAPEMEVRAAVGTRMQFWQSDSPERDTLKGMLDKYASAKPEAFCAELTKFDIDHGINHYWDDYVIDPVASTFGMTKQAEWTWTQGADRLTDEVLTRGVRDGKKIHEICTLYGKDLASEIVENPNTVFDSLPLDSKRIIARILNDTQ